MLPGPMSLSVSCNIEMVESDFGLEVSVSIIQRRALFTFCLPWIILFLPNIVVYHWGRIRWKMGHKDYYTFITLDSGINICMVYTYIPYIWYICIYNIYAWGLAVGGPRLKYYSLAGYWCWPCYAHTGPVFFWLLTVGQHTEWKSSTKKSETVFFCVFIILQNSKKILNPNPTEHFWDVMEWKICILDVKMAQ